MTLPETLISQDKRITNDAMRIVRACFPNIGPAYSDSRKNGRRYKFIQWGHKKTMTPDVVRQINRIFAQNNIRAKAYLHVADGRSHYPDWTGHLCIRTYNESNIKSNNTNTTPIMKSKKNPTAATSQDIVTVIASALDQYLNSKAPQSNSDEIFTFTGEELSAFATEVAEHVAGQCLEVVRHSVIDQDDSNVSIELQGNEIVLDVHMEGFADDIEAAFAKVAELEDEQDSILRWYESVKK